MIILPKAFKCSYCGKIYERSEDAIACELTHFVPDKIVRARFSGKLPYEITLEDEQGTQKSFYLVQSVGGEKDAK